MTERIDPPERIGPKAVVHAVISAPPAIIATLMVSAFAIEVTIDTTIIVIVAGITTTLLLLAGVLVNVFRRVAHPTTTGLPAAFLWFVVTIGAAPRIAPAPGDGIWVLPALSAAAAALIYAASHVKVTVDAAAAINAAVTRWMTF